MKSIRAVPILAALLLAVYLPPPLRAQTQVPTALKPAIPQLVILDTDIGDDIDDAFALALLLHSPEVKLLGITTAFGDTELRARLVERYLKAVGRDQIPVYAGAATPAKNHLTQAAYALEQPARKHGDAADFLLRSIRLYPGKITLVAIGPLFNVQAAIARDPATFRKLKRVVIMGGSVYRGYDGGNSANNPPSAEWNILCDPPGARALLQSGVPVFIMPLDSTQIRLKQSDLAAILAHGSPLTDQLTLLYHQWSGTGAWQTPTLFDPVAATYAVHPDLCPVEPMRLEVDDQGFTRPVAGPPNAQVCLKSDADGFGQFLIHRILADTPR
ncbi:MAG: nucleoside hydrolase [Terracidiphilus sp.]|jgi:inosine-uridine nucleoside N-ribohydrolase